MAIEWVRRRGWKLERDADGHRRYVALFAVETGLPDPRLAAGLPAKGSAWPDDPRAVCTRIEEPVLLAEHAGGSRTYQIEAIYTTKPDA